jgi:prolipoprotein diacylglyceryltransferase
MHAVLFRFGTFEVTSFGVMVAVAALVGLWLFRRELLRAGLPPGAADAAIVGAIASRTPS